MARADFSDDRAGNLDRTSNTLVFPQDMQKEFYPEAIKFSVYERHGVDYEKFKKKVKTAFESGVNFLEAESVLVQSKDDLEKLSTSRGTEAFNAVEDKNKAEKSRNEKRKIAKDKLNDVGSDLAEIKEENKLEKTLERHLQSIYLAMPESVNFVEGVEWQGSDLGVVGGFKSGALSLDKGLADYGILTGGGAALGGAAGLGASLIPGISGIAGTVVGAVLGGSGLQSGIESTFGVKTNPFKEQTFQGVGFRPFDFTFNFRARSQSDVYVIQDIIRAFRSYSKPTFKEGSNGSIFKYPKEFRIEFLTINDDNTYETNEYLPEIKFCICTNVNTNFTAQGWKSFEGGAPVDISLQMTFQETEIVTGEDVDGNTNVGRFKEYGGNF